MPFKMIKNSHRIKNWQISLLLVGLTFAVWAFLILSGLVT